MARMYFFSATTTHLLPSQSWKLELLLKTQTVILTLSPRWPYCFLFWNKWVMLRIRGTFSFFYQMCVGVKFL